MEIISEKSFLGSCFRALRRSFKRTLSITVLLVSFGVAIITALTGPFGSYGREPFMVILTHWALLILIVNFCLFFIHEFFGQYFGPRRSLWRLAGQIICGSFISACVLKALISLFSHNSVHGLPSFLELVCYVAAIMVTISIIRSFIPQYAQRDGTDVLGLHEALGEPPAEPETSPDEGDAQAANPKQSRLAQRLELPDDAEIMRVSASGHYVDVYTRTNKHRVRLRFSDALAEIDQTQGVMTHRSHWVSFDAIEAWTPFSNKPHVILKNGDWVPVSKTYFDTVTAAELKVLQDSTG